MKSSGTLIMNHLLWRGLYFFSVLLLNVCVSRYFAAEKTGELYYIVNNLTFILLVASFCLESGSIFYISSGQLDSIKMARFLILWTIVSGSLTFIIWWFILQHSEPAFPGNTKILKDSIFFIPGVLLTTYFSALYYSKKNFVFPNQILLLVNLLFIILLLFGHDSVLIHKHFILCYFVTYFFQGILLSVSFFIQFTGSNSKEFPSPEKLRKVFYYSIKAMYANIIFFLVMRMDYWFIKKYCSPADLGNYIQASKIGQLLLVIPSILGSSLFALVSSGEAKNTILLASRVLLWINFCLCVVIVLTGYWVFPFLFGQSFNRVYPIFVLLIPGILALTANYPLAASNSANNLIQTNIQGSLWALLIIAVGNFIILPIVGIWSAAVVSSIGYIAYFMYVFLRYQKANNLKTIQFFIPSRQDFLVLKGMIIRASSHSVVTDEIQYP